MHFLKPQKSLAKEEKVFIFKWSLFGHSSKVLVLESDSFLIDINLPHSLINKNPGSCTEELDFIVNALAFCL